MRDQKEYYYPNEYLQKCITELRKFNKQFFAKHSSILIKKFKIQYILY